MCADAIYVASGSRVFSGVGFDVHMIHGCVYSRDYTFVEGVLRVARCFKVTHYNVYITRLLIAAYLAVRTPLECTNRVGQ